MKKTRFTDEQMVVTILREADQRPLPEVARKQAVPRDISHVLGRVVVGVAARQTSAAAPAMSSRT